MSLSRSIHAISRCARIYRAEHLADSDLGQNHHRYLFSVCRHPGISQEELARRAYISKSNVTRHISHLETCGYVERRQSEEDKRVMLVYPTEKAHEALPMLHAMISEWEAAVTAELSEEEREQLSSLLDRIAEKAATLIDDRSLKGEST